MWTPEYYVRLIELPRSVGGAVVPNDDGTFDIYLNSREPEERRLRWLEHELNHIREDHFYRELDAAEKEREADGRAVPAPDTRGRRKELFPSPEALIDYYRRDLSRIKRDYPGAV